MKRYDYENLQYVKVVGTTKILGVKNDENSIEWHHDKMPKFLNIYENDERVDVQDYTEVAGVEYIEEQHHKEIYDC